MAHKYFDFLNYTLGNEDASLELAMMPEGVGHVLAVVGSGSRVTPLLSKSPKRVTCVDVSLDQLSLCELRVETIKVLDYQVFLSFWGYPSMDMNPQQRQEIFESLEISSLAKERIGRVFEQREWKSILYEGKWEKAFFKLSKLNNFFVGKKGTDVFSCRTREEQKKYLVEKFPSKAWSLSIFILGNAVVFNSLLYKGDFPKKNISGSAYSFYSSAFSRLFDQDIVRKNYFLQLLFFGRLRFVEGLPIECEPEVYNKIKRNLLRGVEICYVCGDVIDIAKQGSIPIDFLSLSDTPSYFTSPREQNFLQEIKDKVVPGGLIVNRYYLRTPENLDSKGYKDVTDRYAELISKERTQMYSYGIYQKIQP